MTAEAHALLETLDRTIADLTRVRADLMKALEPKAEADRVGKAPAAEVLDRVVMWSPKPDAAE